MAIPKKLRLFTLFVDGTNHIGKIPSVTLPKVTRKTEDYQGGGRLGAVGVVVTGGGQVQLVGADRADARGAREVVVALFDAPAS